MTHTIKQDWEYIKVQKQLREKQEERDRKIIKVIILFSIILYISLFILLKEVLQ